MKLSRKAIQRMVDSGQVNIGSRRTGSGGGGGGGVSATWVEENYISKEFFNTLFTIHGHDADDTAVPPTDVIIEPNDTETVLDSIEAMVGLWTEKYLSALGLSSGGGGGGDVLAEPLVSINGIGTPTAANRTLVWNGTQWTFQPYGQGGGSVTSIRITVPTGFAVSPSTAITTAGTFAITFASGYSLPSTADQANWNTAYNNSHSHSNKTVLDGITSTKVSNWDTAYGNFDANGNAKSALKLTTVSKTAWGRTYWTSGGVPDSIDGDIENAANIKIDNNKKVSWKKSGASNYLSMLTLDASNNFIVGESMANEGLATYVRGRSINFQTGTGSSGNHAASMSDAGLFTVEKLRIGSIVISEDTQNGGLHVESAGLYADNYISALGANSESGGGVGDVTWSALASSSDTRQIAASHLDVLSNYVTLATAQAISGSKIFTSNLKMAANIQPDTTNQCTVGTSSYRFMGCYFRDGDLSGNLTVGGRVGINGSNSSYRLYVNGASCVSRLVVDNTHYFAINWNNNEYYEVGTYQNTNTEIRTYGMWYGSWRGSSDIRKKNVISFVDVDIEQIAKMPVFNFTWKDGKQGTYLGTSAQEIQKIFPAAVSTMKDGYLAMDYGATSLAAAVLTARKVVNHEERIRQLERENEELRKLLNIA